jgi:hypothetical protein
MSTTVTQLQQPGRVYSYNLGVSYETLNINTDATINVIINSTITSDGNNTVEKQVSSHSEISGNTVLTFNLTSDDLDTLLGTDRSSDESADVTVIANNENDEQLGSSATFSLGDNATEIKTYLAPIISSYEYINSDTRCKVTFDVSVNPQYGEVNDPSNQIVSLYYRYHNSTGNVVTKTLTYDNSFSYVSGGADYRRTGNFEFWVNDLSNGTIYELTFRVKNNALQTSNWSTNQELRPTAQASAITNMDIDTIYDASNNIDASNVKMTYEWEEPDALSYYLSDASAAKLRIGTYDQIYDNSNNYPTFRNDPSYNNTNFYEYVFSQTDLSNAVQGSTFTIDQLDLTQFGVLRSVLETSGVKLYAQVLHDTHLDWIDDSDEPTQQGFISEPFTAYIQVYPTLQNIRVAVDFESGDQTFTVDGTVPSQDNSGVTFTLNNNNNVQNVDFVDTSGSDVLTDGSVNIIEQEGSISYNDLSGNPTVTATLSQVDRNGTQKEDASTKVWSAIQTFETAKFKTPVAPTVDFSGNETDGDDLRTTLRNLNNVVDNGGDAYNVEASDVRYELYNRETDGSKLVDLSYATVGTTVDISHVYVNSDKYWLSATKYASLDQAIVNRYYDAGATNVSDNQFVTKTTTPRLGHYQRTTSASLTLDPIKVDVSYNSGEQTFYFAGKIDSLEASGAILTVTDGSVNIIYTSSITFDSSFGEFEQSVSRTYDDLSGNPTLTATIRQYNFNQHAATDGSFNMTSNEPTFNTYAFKEPADASGTLIKNVVGNDGTLSANYKSEDLGDMNGYDITNLTAEISGRSSNPVDTEGILSDISGAFDKVVDTTQHLHVRSGVNQTISIDASYVVDASYNMKLIKSFTLDDVIYGRYNDASYSIAPVQSKTVTSDNQNTVYYMGNPTITGVTIDALAETITVSADTHGTTLATQDAFTLVLIAKDGLAGYANGDLSGNMGTSVYTNGFADASGYDSATLASTGNQEVSYTFDLSANDITSNATSVAIVDVTNGHSAVSLSNFPDVSGNDEYNSSTN